MSFATVLAIRPSRDRLSQAAHEPGKIAKPISKHFDSVLIAGQRFGAPCSVLVLTGVQLAPACRDLLGRPVFSSLRDDFHHHVQMIAHHRVAPDRHGEDVRQFGNSILDPLPTMFVSAPTFSIVPAEPRATHAT